jgi:hypothetical protein
MDIEPSGIEPSGADYYAVCMQTLPGRSGTEPEPHFRWLYVGSCRISGLYQVAPF